MRSVTLAVGHSCCCERRRCLWCEVTSHQCKLLVLTVARNPSLQSYSLRTQLLCSAVKCNTTPLEFWSFPVLYIKLLWRRLVLQHTVWTVMNRLHLKSRRKLCNVVRSRQMKFLNTRTIVPSGSVAHHHLLSHPPGVKTASVRAYMERKAKNVRILFFPSFFFF